MRPLCLSFKALPPEAVRADLQARLAPFGWGASQPNGFDVLRWHQSLSTPVEVRAGLRERLLRAGDRIDATAFTLVFDRLSGAATREGNIHWTLRARRAPGEFDALVSEVRRQLRQEGVNEPHGHTAHITISYKAPHALTTRAIPPVAWPIDEVLLVEAGGPHPGYDILARRSLRPHPQGALW